MSKYIDKFILSNIIKISLVLLNKYKLIKDIKTMNVNMNTNNFLKYTYPSHKYNNNCINKPDFYNYNIDNSISQTEDISENDVLGIGFLTDPATNIAYGMAARYAEESTHSNPIIQISVRDSSGVNYYNIDISKVDPSNATELEMFAYCNYLDDTKQGTGGAFGTWQTLKCIEVNACEDNIDEYTNLLSNFATIKKDWSAICKKIGYEYLSAGIFKQYKDCMTLYDIFSKKSILGGQP